MLPIEGVVVPVCTPFNDDGSVNIDYLSLHLEWLSVKKVRNVLINGTTAEFFSLTRDERRALALSARRSFKGNVIIHCGYCTLEESIDEIRWAQANGADAVMSMIPWYFAGAPEEGVIAFLSSVSKAATVPLVLYNFTKHTGNSLTKRILENVPHWGIKDSDANLELVGATNNYFLGGERTIVEALTLGARGVVCHNANIVPTLFCELLEAWANNEPEKTLICQKKIINHAQIFNGNYAIAAFKYVLSKLLNGYPTSVRPPLSGITDTLRATIDTYLCGTDF